MLPVRLNKRICTDVDDLVSVVDFKFLLGDGGDLPLGVVVAIGAVHLNDVLAQLVVLRHG